MLQANVLMALADGYDVILEGILSAKSYAGVVGEVLAVHAHENYLFYFDVSLEETLRRHRTRPSRDTATYAENDLRTFYPAEYLPLHAEEKTIPEAYSVDEALAFVAETSGL